MDIQSSRLAYLLQRFTEGVCTDAEKAELMHLVRQEQHHAELNVLIQQTIENTAASRDMQQLRSDELFRSILSSASAPSDVVPMKRFGWKNWMAAASLMIVSGMSVYLFFFSNKKDKTTAQKEYKAPEKIIEPAGNKAVLTLADGSSIILDSAADGTLAQVGNIVIEKTYGQLTYKVSSGVNKDGSAIGGPTSFNTISTPKGGQYQVILPDGTQVWLNAASTLKFPTVFSAEKRNVQLSGEAYFEVAKDKKKPFTVDVNGSLVTVLGTNFNINGYNDEKELNTTLLEGSIKFTNNKEEKTLIPGQQVVYTSSASSMIVQDADIKQVMGWKNGFFEFDNMKLRGIMRQIARWYDVDVQYLGSNSDIQLSGGISRKLSLQDLQKLMEANGIHFVIEGRKLIVSAQ